MPTKNQRNWWYLALFTALLIPIIALCDDLTVPQLPQSGNWRAWGWWAASATAAIVLPIIGGILKHFFDRWSEKRKEKAKREASYVSRADLELSMGNLTEAVHEGQKSTERLLEVMNSNVNNLSKRLDTLNERVDRLTDAKKV